MPFNDNPSLLDKILSWYGKTNPWFKAFAFSLTMTIPSCLSAVLSYWVKRGLDEKHLLQTYSIATAVVLAIFFLGKRYLDMRTEERDRLMDAQRKSLGQSHNLSDELIAERLERIRRGWNEYRNDQQDGTNLFKAVVGSVDGIKEVVERLYVVLEAQYSNTEDNINQINFEVTFMTKSYIDDKITIWAWRNRDRRAPRSLGLRSQNRDVYSPSMTAWLYSQEKPEMVVTEDTSDPEARYQALYEGQKNRIKSSIVYPVFSDMNELLGTLVVHCDRECFFRTSDRKFWGELLEIYAKRIALEKVGMDCFRELELMPWADSIDRNLLFNN
ncbi:MAG: GAF domain-containing protein [Acidobacteriia bacterium]|nr:GAF domain-containing protein [Terriglobia bacterium]